MKTIDIYGISIQDYPLKELLKSASDNLNTPGVTTISWMSDAVLLSISENTEQYDWFNDIDITIYLKNGGKGKNKTGKAESNDGKSQDFVETYFKYVASTGVEVALVCDTDGHLEKMKTWLENYSHRLKITSEYVIDDLDNKDDLFNYLNGRMNRLVITCMSWDLQGPLIMQAHRFSNASVFLSVLPEMLYDNKDANNGIFAKISERIFGKKRKKYL